MGCRDSDRSVPKGAELLAAVDVGAQLAPIGPVLIAVVLDDHLELLEEQIDSAERVRTSHDDEIAVWLRQTGQHEAQPEPGLTKRVDPLADQ